MQHSQHICKLLHRIDKTMAAIIFLKQEEYVFTNPLQEAITNRKTFKELLKLDPDKSQVQQK